jgi:hypothetical protein
MTLEELSRVSQAMGIQSDLLCFFYREGSGSGVLIALLQRHRFVRGANIFTDRSTDGRKKRGIVSFGNREPWRNRMSFSQEAGPFVGALSIGFISTAKGCCIEEEAAALFCTSFPSDIRGRG